MAKIQVIFYSMYGHCYQLARAVADGAASVDGAQVQLFRVPELMDEETLKRVGAWEAQQQFTDVPVIEPEQLIEADAIIVGTPTRFGNMCAQMRAFWDRTVDLWLKGRLVGKLASAFVSIGTQHGGHETTVVSIWHTFAHLGMVIVPIGYSDQRVLRMDQITGGGPYGASTLSDVDGSRLPTENELAIARHQGAYVTSLAAKLAD
jgi:NAD(P)H dehydrogenase (quinone)